HVYDLKLGPGNLLYVCGKGFVSAFQLNGTPCGQLALSVAHTACSAIATASGGAGTYNFNWNPGAQNSPAITNVASGDYTVSVADASCIPKTQSAVVNLQGVTAGISGNNYACIGNTVVLTASGGNIFLWNTGSVTATINVSPATSTVYKVIASDTNGCF